MNVKMNDSINIYLTWNEWQRTSNDYDLFLYNGDSESKKGVDRSTEPQTGFQPPTEEIVYEAQDTESKKYYIAVKNKNADGNAKISIFCPSHELQFISEDKSYSHSIIDPAVSDKVIAVGATYRDQDILETYSSQGPANDATITKKPDICAPSRVSNYTYGSFGGTSASAPHASGAAGLLLSQDITRSNIDLMNLLETSAIDLGDKGKDNVYGSGARFQIQDCYSRSAFSTQ